MSLYIPIFWTPGRIIWSFSFHVNAVISICYLLQLPPQKNWKIKKPIKDRDDRWLVVINNRIIACYLRSLHEKIRWLHALSAQLTQIFTSWSKAPLFIFLGSETRGELISFSVLRSNESGVQTDMKKWDENKKIRKDQWENMRGKLSSLFMVASKNPSLDFLITFAAEYHFSWWIDRFVSERLTRSMWWWRHDHVHTDGVVSAVSTTFGPGLPVQIKWKGADPDNLFVYNMPYACLLDFCSFP